MKSSSLFFALVILVQSFSAFAQKGDGNHRYRVRSTLSEIENMDASQTCLNEYLERRNQLAMKLGLSPATVIGLEGGGLAAGYALGAVWASQVAANAGFADLIAMLAGIGLGVVVGTGTTVASITTNIVKLTDANRIFKIVFDARLGHGRYLHDFFVSHQKMFSEEMTEENLAGMITELDSSRELCDGTHARTGWLRRNKLKNQIVRTPKELAVLIASDQ